MSSQDEFFMHRALKLAKMGLYHVAPNPMVGAVIVYEGKIIGEGYHQQLGQAHAEVNAIYSVKDEKLLASSTLYVNLEPCSHYGKTPPCSELIIEKKIKEVVIANPDASEKVSGKGIERLKQNGVIVRSGILEKEGAELNKRFIGFHSKKRPYITLKWAVSQDGFIGRDPNDPNKEDSWITNTLSKQLVHQWRAEEMGILVGKNTAIVDDPELSCREFEGRNPIRFLIDPELEVDPKSKIFNPIAQTVVLNLKKEGREGNIQFVLFKKEDGIFSSLFAYCNTNEIQSILVEGGAHTLKEFLENNFWDEARVFHGKKEFTKGIKAPNTPFEAIHEEEIREDRLQYFKNSTL